MNEVMDFEETESLNEDIFDCEYTSVDAVINEVTVFTGCKERQTENGTRTLIAYGEGIGASAFYTDSKKLKDVVLPEAQISISCRNQSGTLWNDVRV